MMRRAIGIVTIAVASGSAAAASTNLSAGEAWDVPLRDAAGGTIGAGAIDVFLEGGEVGLLNWRATAYNGFTEVAHELTLHRSDGSFVRSLASFTGTAFKSFVRRQGQTVYFGLDSDIYAVRFDGAAPAGTVATLGNAYDLQFDPGGRAFAVANPGWAGNHIYQVDLSGADAHRMVVRDAGSYSAELAFDSGGNLCYGTYNLGPNELRSFTSAQLDAAIASGTPLGWTDGAHLTDLEYGAGGMECDEQDNLLFTLNGAEKGLYVIASGATYTGTYRYGRVCWANYWTTVVDALGDVTAYDGGADNAAFTCGGGVASVVPEPAAGALLALAAAALGRRRRRR